MKRLAVIKVRGNIRVDRKIRATMAMMNLTRVNHCVLIDDRDSYLGMLQKSKDWITWGEVSEDNVIKLLTKRAKITDELVKQKTKYKTVEEFAKAFMKMEAELADLGINPVFRLSPPKKGYENTKAAFANKGSLGYRGEEINKLLARMI